MALPPIVLAEEEPIRLLVPWDDAIDVESCREAHERYVMAGLDFAAPVEGLDVSTLTLRPGIAPTWLTVRALTQREAAVVRAIQGSPPEDGSASAYLTWAAALHVRFGLVAVEGWDGWQGARREPLYGLHPWRASVVDALPPELVQFVGLAILKLSTLDVKKNGRSGSSRGAHGGTAGASTGTDGGAGAAPSTAAGATTDAAASERSDRAGSSATSPETSP